MGLLRTTRELSRRRSSRDRAIWAEPFWTKKPLDSTAVRAEDGRGSLAYPCQFHSRHATPYQKRGASQNNSPAQCGQAILFPAAAYRAGPPCCLRPCNPFLNDAKKPMTPPAEWRAGRRRGFSQRFVDPDELTTYHEPRGHVIPRSGQYPARFECSPRVDLARHTGGPVSVKRARDTRGCRCGQCRAAGSMPL
jgi:hypothetical protein